MPAPHHDAGMLAGRYRIVGDLGEGAEGDVFDGVDTWSANAPVAIKRVKGSAQQRLRNEFFSLRSLTHQGLVRAYDLFREAGHDYLVEERIDGLLLRAWAPTVNMPAIFAALAPVAHALGHLHARGMVHLDASPGNIVLRSRHDRCSPSAVLIDLGLTRAVGQGVGAGTPGYIAPELLAGEPPTPAADVYSLAASALRAHFEAAPGSANESLLAKVASRPIADALERCLRENPAERPDALEMARTLAALGEGDSPAFDPAAPITSLSLVGVSSEQGKLEAWLHSPPGFLAVVGAAGMGKSAMLQEAADRARLLGMRVLTCQGGTAGSLSDLVDRASAGVPEAHNDPKPVIPANEGIQESASKRPPLDPRVRGDDGAYNPTTLTGTANQSPPEAFKTHAAPDTAMHTGSLDDNERARLAVLLLDGLAAKEETLVLIDDAHLAHSDMRIALKMWRHRPSGQGLRILASELNGEDAAAPPNPSVLQLPPLSDVATCELLRLSYGHKRPPAEAHHLVTVCGRSPRSLLTGLRVLAQERLPPIELRPEHLSTESLQSLPTELAPLAQLREPVPFTLAYRILGLAGTIDVAQQRLVVSSAIDAGLLTAWPGDASMMLDAPRWVTAMANVSSAAAHRSLIARAFMQEGHEQGRTLRAAVYYAAAGEVVQAEEILLAPGRRPDDLLRRAIIDSVTLAPSELCEALLELGLKLCSRSGDLQGVGLLVDALGPEKMTHERRVWLAQAQVKAGRYDEAIDTVVPVDAGGPKAAVLARAQFFAGRASLALDISTAHLEDASGEDLLHILDVAGHASFACGQGEVATEYLNRALDVALELGSEHVVGRAQHALAIVMQRRGRPDDARPLYLACLKNADSLSKTLRQLNYATLLQDMGHVVEARGLYRDCLSRAVAVNHNDQRARVGVNLANLEVLLGDVSEGVRVSDETAQLAQEQNMPHAELMARLVAAEANIVRRNLSAADHDLSLVAELLTRVDDGCAAAEATMLRARLALLRDKHEEARGLMSEVDSGCAPHLERQQAYWLAQIAARSDTIAKPMDVAHAMNSVTGADAAADREMLWRALATLARLQHTMGDVGAAATAERANAARKHWMQSLPENVRYSYGALTDNRLLATWMGGGKPMAHTSTELHVLKKLVAINRRLARQRSVEPLLELIIDSAVELLGAERGFLVLAHHSTEAKSADEAVATVAVARSLDRETLNADRGNISYSIAREVLSTGESVLTTNAQEDSRFAHAKSIVSLKVRSVLCVPLRRVAPGEDPVMGALYLDHRFQERAFSEADVEITASFADQAAIALDNARMLAMIEEQSGRLQEQNVQLGALNTELKNQVVSYAAEAEEALRRLRDEGPTVGVGKGFERFVGGSAGLRQALKLVDRFADTDVPVMIHGESGTGKEFVARALHERSRREEAPFISINCGAVPDTLIESELFGYERGAFTGATGRKKGLIAAAEGGTLFLDEIGEMSAAMQVKLLRVLQEREYRPVGATKSTLCNIRVVSASHKDLQSLIKAGEFREDLFYRLQVVDIIVPPLRERREDIPALVEHFCVKALTRLGRPSEHADATPAEGRFSKAALARLFAYAWPGNVRELENEVVRCVALADGIVQVEDLSERVRGASRSGQVTLAQTDQGSLKHMMATYEKQVLLAVIERAGWNVKQAAKNLGLSRAALYTRMTRYEIRR